MEDGGREQWQVLSPSPAELLHCDSLSMRTAVVSRTPSSVGCRVCVGMLDVYHGVFCKVHVWFQQAVKELRRLCSQLFWISRLE